MGDIEVAWNQSLVDEMDAFVADAMPEGMDRWRGGFVWKKHTMWQLGHIILRHYPELGEEKERRGRGGVTISFRSVAEATGYAQPTIKRWVEVAKAAGLTEETFTEYIEPVAALAWDKVIGQFDQDAIEAPDVPLPDGEYNVIYADPPWEYRNSGFEMSAAQHYPTMPTEKICALDVPVADNAVCFMWVTNPLLPDGLQVLGAWGFEYKTNLVWVKDRHTAGFYVYGQHELLLIGVRGSGMLPIEEAKPKSVITGGNDVHSKKPDSVYAMIDAMYPQGKRIEMFARQRWEGWEAWGNEI